MNDGGYPHHRAAWPTKWTGGGQIQAFGLCKIEGYKIRTDQKGTWCVPTSGNGLEWPMTRP
ncbi:hypothetical protein ACI01nite_27060 [Acetobacter cibinongensis]|uniref:Plasmid replication protein n=1 Tax=Acetobacter cibinongensis TaxID=146475 RepID=A0A0D6N4Z3_9PROT|nr:plasmid replication protein [Acetobacter cibinongensis]GBQ14041.1 hypothetical protein AA0482_0783 [Acetobacter cibinongensis NRIC 0482]GEL60104.1 hypothetical protein ACI01nite_27060 [Acetobacter cibinongensis]